MGRTRENRGIYSLSSWEKDAVVSERRKAQLHKIVLFSFPFQNFVQFCAIVPFSFQIRGSQIRGRNGQYMGSQTGHEVGGVAKVLS